MEGKFGHFFLFLSTLSTMTEAEGEGEANIGLSIFKSTEITEDVSNFGLNNTIVTVTIYLDISNKCHIYSAFLCKLTQNKASLSKWIYGLETLYNAFKFKYLSCGRPSVSSLFLGF